MFFDKICNWHQAILLDTLHENLGDGMQDFEWSFIGDWDLDVAEVQFDYYGREESFDLDDPYVRVKLAMRWETGPKMAKFYIGEEAFEYPRTIGPGELADELAAHITRALEEKKEERKHVS